MFARALAGLGGSMVTPTAIAAAAGLAPPERRGRAISTVMAGLSAATALGAIGTAIGSLTGDWRITMVFVSVLGAVAAPAIALLLPKIPNPPLVPLRTRLAPLGDRHVGMGLLTTLLLFTGLYIVYSYIADGLDRATGGSGTTLAILLFV
nr:MFS transporter [Streptomyces sp. CB01883]